MRDRIPQPALSSLVEIHRRGSSPWSKDKPEMTPSFLSGIRMSKATKALDLSGCMHLGPELVEPAFFDPHPNLTSLNISWCTQMPGNALARMVTHSLNLSTLRMTGCRQLTGKAISFAISMCPFLKELNIDDCAPKTTLFPQNRRSAIRPLETLSANRGASSTTLPLNDVVTTCPNLTALSIDRYEGVVSLDDLLPVASRLTLLKASGTEILFPTSHKTAFPVLVSLDMSRSWGLTDDALNSLLSGSPHLKELRLRETSVTDVAFESLPLKAKSMAVLDIRDCGCNGIGWLGSLTGLKDLNVRGCKTFDNSNLRDLRELHTLKAGWGLRDTDMAHLPATLSALTIGLGNEVSSYGLSLVTPSLRKLRLHFMDLRDHGGGGQFCLFSHFTNLERLTLDCCWGSLLKPSGAEGAVIGQKMHVFRVTGGPLSAEVSDDFIGLNLRRLELFKAPVTDLSLSLLYCLHSLRLEDCASVSYSGILTLLEHCTALKAVYLRHCCKIPASFVLSGVELCPHLVNFTLDRCDLSEEAIDMPTKAKADERALNDVVILCCTKIQLASINCRMVKKEIRLTATADNN